MIRLTPEERAQADAIRREHRRLLGALRLTPSTMRARTAPPPARCKHLGAPLSFARRRELRLYSDAGSLAPCAKGYGVKREGVGYVCPCFQSPSGCKGCRDFTTPRQQFEWISTAQLVRDAVLLAAKLPPTIVGIAGIPRSGMVPASIVATQLHLPLWQLTESGQLTQLGHGARGRAAGWSARAGPIAVIDDTVYAGHALRRARKALRGKEALYCAVYVRPEARAVVDRFARELPSPHLLEWNLFNNGPFTGAAADPAYGRGVALDFDGIVCHDAESGGPIGAPYLLPRARPCRLIVTGRRESARGVTEAWLHRWGVRAERLVMVPDGEPDSFEFNAAFKARHYTASGCGFFVESEPAQAEIVHRLSRKPVICPRAGKVWS